jgi:hypothetical protein
MPLYLVQDSDRPLFIIGRSYQDAVVQWKQVVASENLDDDGRLPDIQDPDGVQKLCDDDDLAGNLLAAQVPDLRVPRSAVRQLVAGHPSDAGWMHDVTHDALVNFLRWADAVRNSAKTVDPENRDPQHWCLVVTPTEFHSLLAALRHYAEALRGGSLANDVRDIASNADEVTPLDADQVDELATRLNVR